MCGHRAALFPYLPDTHTSVRRGRIRPHTFSRWPFGQDHPRFGLPNPLHAGRRLPNVRGRHVWEEQETGDRSVRLPQPLANGSATDWKSGSIRLPECVDPPARRRRVADHQQASDSATRPPTRPRDIGSKSCLAIDAAEGGLRVRDDRFDLGDQNDPRRPVISEHVDRATFPADRERHLDIGLPAVASKAPDELLDEAGVRLVEQSIQTFAIPPKTDLQGRVECLRHRSAKSRPSRSRGDRVRSWR